MIKVLQDCILKLSLHSVNPVLILYRTGNMQSAILLSFVAPSSLPPCGFQSTLVYQSCVVYNVYGHFYTLFLVTYVQFAYFYTGREKLMGKSAENMT